MKGRPSILFASPYLLFIINCTNIDYKYVLIVLLLNSIGGVEEFLRIGEGWSYYVTHSQLYRDRALFVKQGTVFLVLPKKLLI